MKKYLTIIMFSCAAVYAQSPLALQYPIGLPDMAISGQAAAMGGSGSAVAEEFYGTALNPANAAIGRRSSFSALITFNRTTINDDGDSKTISTYAPKMLSLILPLGVGGNLGFAMQRQYDANLNYYSRTETPMDAISSNTNTIDLQNVGGLTAWQAGWAYRLKHGLGFGIAYERLYYNYNSRNSFESIFRYNTVPASSFTTYTQEETEMTFASDGIRLGVQVPILSNLTAAASGEYIFKSDNGSIKREYFRVDDRRASPLDNDKDDFEIHLPPSWNLGLAYRPSELWLVSADFNSTIWDSYSNSEGKPDDLRTMTVGVAAGGRFLPATSNRLSAKYWEKIRYSAGAKYNQLPLDEAYEYGFTAGFGLPIPNDGGVIDLVFEYGIRTDGRYSDYSENIFKFHLGINGGRNWFLDQRRR